jgi:hypothetical protein
MRRVILALPVLVALGVGIWGAYEGALWLDYQHTLRSDPLPMIMAQSATYGLLVREGSYERAGVTYLVYYEGGGRGQITSTEGWTYRNNVASVEIDDPDWTLQSVAWDCDMREIILYVEPASSGPCPTCPPPPVPPTAPPTRTCPPAETPTPTGTPESTPSPTPTDTTWPTATATYQPVIELPKPVKEIIRHNILAAIYHGDGLTMPPEELAEERVYTVALHDGIGHPWMGPFTWRWERPTGEPISFRVLIWTGGWSCEYAGVIWISDDTGRFWDP